MNGEIRIGTSGWHYKHWVNTYYPAKFPASKMLDFYTQHFDTVEINNSFYRLPAIKTAALWRDTTPGRFCFSMKASRFITHNKKLKDPAPAIARVLPLLETLGPKAGPLLFQLPPRWELNLERLGQFLSVLPGEFSYAFEFRNHSWHTERIPSPSGKERCLLRLSPDRVPFAARDHGGFRLRKTAWSGWGLRRQLYGSSTRTMGHSHYDLGQKVEDGIYLLRQRSIGICREQREAIKGSCRKTQE